ncbi:MAG: universal stress protein [Nitrospirae bacterium]|nr:universal stress protein [Nitrospirota bacterium]MBF0539875.1 universal stress protein [Nitrospirota bacterium]
MICSDNNEKLIDLLPQKRILIVADDADSSKRAVMFVADLLGGQAGYSISLVNFTRIPVDLFPGDEAVEWAKNKHVDVEIMLESYKGILMSAGFLESAISSQIIIEPFSSTAQRILDFQRENNFCILVIGNRDLKREEEILFGSTTKRIINICKKNCAVWVID